MLELRSNSIPCESRPRGRPTAPPLPVVAVLVALALLPIIGCSGLDEIEPSAHVVAAPISPRANRVVERMVAEYGSPDGRWGGCMSDGCVEIWGTQFFYRAGTRRDRDDLLELGELMAGRIASDLRGAVWDAIFGEARRDDPALFGFPALLVSGALGDRGMDAFLFESVISRADEHLDSLDRRERAGIAAILATSAELNPDDRDARLTRARELAESAADGGGYTWQFLALSTIARVTGEVRDIEAARASLARTNYRFDDPGRIALPLDMTDEVLSRILSLIHGLVDLYAATGDAKLHRGATSVLDFVFSDAYYEDGTLIHDRVFGRSEDVCTGCNFMALYLVDRLYGDSFVIDPLPDLPDEPWHAAPDEEPEIQTWDTILHLGAGTEEKPGTMAASMSGLRERGGFVFRHEREPVWLEVRYEVGTLGGQPSITANVVSFFDDEKSESELAAGFDASGVARLRCGSPPLYADLEFTRTGSELSLQIRLSERRD